MSAGDSYQMTSASPLFEPAVLAATTSLTPGDDIYFQLPDDFPADAAALAREVTAGAANSYEAAVLLQDWFRSEFEYSLEVQPGHGNNAIEGFLRDKVGYCEQFAGTYAAMMRSLDIPARVAVGFTHGTVDRNGVLRDRTQRARLARSVVRRIGLGAVRAHSRSWCAGNPELHGGRRGPGQLDRLSPRRTATSRYPTSPPPPSRPPGRPRSRPSPRRTSKRSPRRHPSSRSSRHRTRETRGYRSRCSPRPQSPSQRHRSDDGSGAAP